MKHLLLHVFCIDVHREEFIATSPSEDKRLYKLRKCIENFLIDMKLVAINR